MKAERRDNMDKCSHCRKALCEELGLDPLDDWLKIMNYFEIELTQSEITNATWETLTNAMLSFRPDRKEGDHE